MRAEDILTRLEGVRSTPNGWMALCPAHDDRNSSLSVSEGHKGIVLHCHAGCSFHEIVAALNLRPEDFFHDNGKNRPQVAHRHDYHDESGQLLYQVERLFPKGFRQRRALADGGWSWKLGNVPRVLYRLPDVRSGVAQGQTVFVVEGEKDADRLASLGLLATTCPGGAGKWKASYTEVLRDATVVVIPDNDDPGRKHAYEVARSLHGVAKDLRVLELPGLPPKGDVSDWLDRGGSTEELARLEQSAPQWTQELDANRSTGRPSTVLGRQKSGPPSPSRGGDEGVRPIIQAREQLTDVTEEALKAIQSRPDLGVFVRGRELVTVARDGSPRATWGRRPPGAPVIVSIEHARMLGILDAAAIWKKWNVREHALVSARPPDWVAAQLLCRPEWPLRYLVGVVETPTLRPDGSVIDTPGWDEATGLLYEPGSDIPYPPMIERPTKEDAEKAARALLDPVAEFPFLAPSDRAAYVSVVLTLLGRHLIRGPAPGFPIRAPTPGTGKTLLAEVISLIGTGREPGAMTMTHQPDEFRKRILALAIEGDLLVLLENVSGSVGSDVLAAALTATTWRDRILGHTEMRTVPLHAVWIMTGNNLAFRRTLGRRVVPIDLDAKMETPEDRSNFAFPDLRSHVRQTRGELVTAGLTLLRAFLLAGAPRHLGARMGSYESWDDLVRSAVIWAGLEDPAPADDPGSGRGRVRSQADDDLDHLGSLLEILSTIYPQGLPFTTAQVISDARENQELSGLLDTAAGPKRGGHATTGSVGATFREYKDRPFQGLVLRRQGRTWKLDVLGSDDT